MGTSAEPAAGLGYQKQPAAEADQPQSTFGGNQKTSMPPQPHHQGTVLGHMLTWLMLPWTLLGELLALVATTLKRSLGSGSKPAAS